MTRRIAIWSLLGPMLAANVICRPASAAKAPDWLHALVGAPLPPHDEKTNAVILLADEVLTIDAKGAMKLQQRIAAKILRPDGESLGTVRVHFDADSSIKSLRAWSIPASGKDYEVKERDAVETALYGVANGNLVSSLRTKVLHIPAAVPGNIIGYEVQQEIRPYMRTAEWSLQRTLPVREARFRLKLPPGWTFQATWFNQSEIAPTSVADQEWQWSTANIKPVRLEAAMPPWQGIAARMNLAFLAPNSQDGVMRTWQDIGTWYRSLTVGRTEVTPAIRQQVAAVTAGATTTLAKMQALAQYVQDNIRYVAIELGIGGYQPHSAESTFVNRYGDCKDKATLLMAMLKEIGVDSYYVVVNTRRGSINATTPPTLDFDHVILAIVLPADTEKAPLAARVVHDKLGNILYFDPTDELTPFGRLIGALQSGYGLLVTTDGGELVQLPKLPSNSNSVERTAKLTLDASGTLQGEFDEAWSGDPAAEQRFAMRTTTQASDQIRPVEQTAAHSFSSFQILKATVGNAHLPDKPFFWHYTIEAPGYAKTAGDLLLVRPRVLGSKSSGLLETEEPREHDIEFERPQRDTDVFEIAIPNGYKIDQLPRAINVDEGFASYRSKSEIVGQTLRYTRVFEIKELSVPVRNADKLKALYRTIADDERQQAVFERTGP